MVREKSSNSSSVSFSFRKEALRASPLHHCAPFPFSLFGVCWVFLLLLSKDAIDGQNGGRFTVNRLRDGLRFRWGVVTRLGIWLTGITFVGAGLVFLTTIFLTELVRTLITISGVGDKAGKVFIRNGGVLTVAEQAVIEVRGNILL